MSVEFTRILHNSSKYINSYVTNQLFIFNYSNEKFAKQLCKFRVTTYFSVASVR